jgi:hypothetical protein
MSSDSRDHHVFHDLTGLAQSEQSLLMLFRFAEPSAGCARCTTFVSEETFVVDSILWFSAAEWLQLGSYNLASACCNAASRGVDVALAKDACIGPFFTNGNALVT